MYTNKKFNKDWICPQCGNDNFGSRDKCKKCGCFRSKALKSNSNSDLVIKKGDWNCSCGELNFASRTNCRKCNKEKNNTNKDNQQKIEIKPGDWWCKSCEEMNFGTRIKCYKCGTEKERLNPEKTDGQCVICMERDADMCIKICGHVICCSICIQQIDYCPMCKKKYDKNTDLMRVYKS